MLVYLLTTALVASAPLPLDGNAAAQVYDGHGALSAGASSRLLIDYPEPQRSDILDLLFKPNHGAAMHMIKVEIGGDGQSTDGTEPSHMHHRDDLSCERGYEFWLLQEARKRNPKIKTYALSWASPWWVGNQTGYYSDDEIAYHIKWLECTKQYDIGSIDYMGNWNERPWGTADWTLKFKAAMEEAGFGSTEIIVPDGGGYADVEKAIDADPALGSAVGGIGLHYPCNRPAPEVQGEYGLKYWSSEDYSTVGDWDGAACWGRLLNQNFVRMNMTSTISWSLVWSVYAQGFSYFGNGLMYAFSPWSGYYEAGQDGTDNGAAIWTNAHTCQFTEVGWRYLAAGKGAGSLAGGGSYVTLVSPSDAARFTIVAEKLEGRCLRCAGQTTSDELVTFALSGGLQAARTLQLWRTNLTHRFVSEGNVSVGADDTVSVAVGKDSVVTLSSWFNGQAKVLPAIPADAPFPLPYADSFEGYKADAEAKYFADNGGSFQVAAAPAGGARAGMVLKQWVKHENGVNRWARNVDPISLIGNASWSDVSVSVAVLLGEGGAAPVPAPTPAPGPRAVQWKSKFNGQCLDVAGRLTATGAAVDTWTCVSAANEDFAYDAASGNLVDANSKKCVTTTACPKPGSLCIGECSAADAHAQWTVGADETIRPRAAPSSCLQVATKVLDATLSLGACDSPPSDGQLWAQVAPPTPQTGSYAGACVRTSPAGKGVCLLLDDQGAWALRVNGAASLASGKVSKDVTKEWTTLGISATGETVTVSVDGEAQAPVTAALSAGMVSVNSGYNVAYFDDFAMKRS